MLLKLKKAYEDNIGKQPLHIKMIAILMVSVFLPVYLTVPVLLIVFGYVVSSKERLKFVANFKRFVLPGALSCLVLVTSLIYKNYIGFACGLLFIFFIVLELYVSSIMTEKLFDFLSGVVCAASFVSAGVAVLERVIGHEKRVMAFTYNPNFYAYLVELILLICVYKFASTKKPVYLLAVGANVIGLMLTQCRTGWIATSAGLFIYFWITKKKNLMIRLSALGVAVIAAISYDHSLFPRYDTIIHAMDKRFYIWNLAFTDFLAHPIFGRGFLALYQVTSTSVQHIQVFPHAHNLFLDLLECTGIVGVTIFGCCMILIVRDLINSFRSGNDAMKMRVALCAAILTATMVHGITDFPVMGVQTGLFFFLMLSLRPIYSLNEAEAQSSSAMEHAA